MTEANPTIDTASGQQGGKRPPRVTGGLPLLGQLLELRRAPLDLFWRVYRECGELGEMNWAGQKVVMFFGEEAHEAFFRAPDEQLDQATAYPFMTPIFGKGVVFDATPEQRKQAMKNSSLRDKMMRGHAERIATETERMIESWGETGEIDLLDFFGELTLYTSSACLVGQEFRKELTPEYWTLFQDLEMGTDAFAYVNPYLPLPSFRKRDKARKRLSALIEAIIARRKAEGRQTQDLVYVLTTIKNPDGTPRYTSDQITGMFISMMFAGHHTTSGTSAWTLLELLLNPEAMKGVVDELDAIYADGREVSYQALREIPELECALKETLRLHPPLIILMRKVMGEPFQYKDYVMEPGVTVAVSPAVSNRMPEYFPDPERFDLERYRPGRDEDKQSFAWLPFGAGRHRCVGAAFAMVQLKAIFSVILRQYEFELSQRPATYHNDHSKMVVTLNQPCRVRYRRRKREQPAVARTIETAEAVVATGARMIVDIDLCQGHGVCVGECPEIFEVDESQMKVKLLRDDLPAELREKAEAAVQYCPTHALEIVED